MAIKICENITFDNLFIDKGFNTIRLYVKFDHFEDQYDAYFRYIHSLKVWYLSEILHSNNKPCLECLKNLPRTRQENLQCVFFDQFYRIGIEREILGDANIKEKLKNFRLEAITAGFDY
jgi:hypothetical protein